MTTRFFHTGGVPPPPPPTTTSGPSGQCSPGWAQFGSSCYKFFSQGGISWTDARSRYRVSHKSDFTLFFAILLCNVHPKCKSWGSFEKFRIFAT